MTERADNLIPGWQERFPMPDAMDNYRFFSWASDLDHQSHSQLILELLHWANSQGITSETDEHPLLEKFDTFIGEAIQGWKSGYNWFPGLSARTQGMYLRICATHTVSVPIFHQIKK